MVGCDKSSDTAGAYKLMCASLIIIKIDCLFFSFLLLLLYTNLVHGVNAKNLFPHFFRSHHSLVLYLHTLFHPNGVLNEYIRFGEMLLVQHYFFFLVIRLFILHFSVSLLRQIRSQSIEFVKNTLLTACLRKVMYTMAVEVKECHQLSKAKHSATRHA